MKLFGKIPYEVRDLDSAYLSIENVEEGLEQISPIISISEIQHVFNNNRDNPYNLHLTVYKDVELPDYPISYDYDGNGQVGVNITFEHSNEVQPNIVKLTCKELGVSQKELANLLDVKPTAVSNWANGDIPKLAQLVLEQMLEIKDLKEKLNKVSDFKVLLNSL